MPCVLYDSAHYTKTQRRRLLAPKIPKIPKCRPTDLETINVPLFMTGFAFCFFLIFSTVFTAIFFNIFILAFMLPLCILSIFALAGSVLLKSIKEERALQDPVKNPHGHKYQGRVLSEDDPHYLLHMQHYRITGSWILPDEIALDGFNPFEAADRDYHIRQLDTLFHDESLTPEESKAISIDYFYRQKSRM